MGTAVIFVAVAAAFACMAGVEWSMYRLGLVRDELPSRRPRLRPDEAEHVAWVHSLRDDRGSVRIGDSWNDGGCAALILGYLTISAVLLVAVIGS